MKKYYILILFLLFTVSQYLSAQVIINEFMAANYSSIYDPDNEESTDWIELYNKSPEEVDLSGYFLTDNLGIPNKWLIPEGTKIQGLGFLIIWADGLDFGLHASFKLSGDGEEIGLFAPDLLQIDGFSFGMQETDISYGRQGDGEPYWFWFQHASPGYSNDASTPYAGITRYKTKYSLGGGFYQTELSLELTSLGGIIHYTLDGSTPTLEDPIYTDPLWINQTTFVRACVFQHNFIPGPVITHSYFFDDSFEARGLPVVSLVTDADYFWSSDSGLYVQDFKPDWEYPINIELFENDGNNRSVFNERAGVRVNGRNSWELPQKMLGIYFRKKYGENSLDYPLFDDRERNSYNEIILRAGGSDWSYSLFRDGLGQDLTQENASVAHQGFRPSMVFINGEYLGIHNIRSRVDDGFIESNYSLASGTYDLIENDGVVHEGNEEQYGEMDALFNNDLSVDHNFELISEIVDIENYSDYWISEIWEANYSWGHNINLWKPHEGGQWQFIFADMDRAFIDPHYSISHFAVPVGDGYYDYARYWMQSMFENEAYSDYFVQRFNDHIYTTFHPRRVHEKIDGFKNTIANEIPYHVDQWSGSTSNYGDGIATVEDWEEEVMSMKGFAEERQVFLMEDLQSFFQLGPIANLSTACWPSDGGEIHLNEFMIPSQPWDGPYFEQYPFQLKTIANPGFQFLGWSAILKRELIHLEEPWKYHDLGQDLGSAWKESDFDDSAWSEGQAELGYGDGDENSIVSYGENSEDKYITTYFRKSFDYDSNDPVKSVVLKIRRDDGAVIYLNGAEIVRNNMPTGDINYETRALSKIFGNTEDQLVEYIFDDITLENTNVIAVEIHQIDKYSPDISFDLSFTANSISDELISLEEVLDVQLSSDSGFIARYESTSACLLPHEISSNTVLSIDCSPYMATGDLTILPDISLSIDPGVEIWFPEDASMIVQGDLQVNGSPSQSVIFNANEEYGSTRWDAVIFDHSTGINHLNYLEIRNASSGPHPVHHKAAISSIGSELVLDHLLLDKNFKNPIYAINSDINISNSLLHSHITGDLINVKYGNCVIDSCTFIGNNQVDTDAIDLDGVSQGWIKDSSFENFYGDNSDGVDLGEESQQIRIENCFFNDITDKGISIGQSSSANITNNTIVNCNLGIGIKDEGSAMIEHTTFYSNGYAISVYEKNPGAGGGQVSIHNSILSNSSQSPLFVDEMSMGVASNNVYDSQLLPGYENEWMDPQFVNPGFYDFQLLPTSDAINGASDGENLGTLNHQFSSAPKLLITDLLYDHPYNPDKEFIRILNPGEESIDMSGYRLSKGIYFVFPKGSSIAAHEKILVARDTTLFTHLDGQLFQWTSGHLANEGEKLLLSDPYGIIIDHLSYLPEYPWPVLQEIGDYISLGSINLDNHFGSHWILGEPLGVSENLENHTLLELYPNPCSKVLNIRSAQSIRSVQIFDITGREMMSSRYSSSSIQIKVNELEPGVYMLVIDGNQVIRFVKG